MEPNTNLICIYDDTNENINEILIDIYAKFVKNTLENDILN